MSWPLRVGAHAGPVAAGEPVEQPPGARGECPAPCRCSKERLASRVSYGLRSGLQDISAAYSGSAGGAGSASTACIGRGVIPVASTPSRYVRDGWVDREVHHDFG